MENMSQASGAFNEEYAENPENPFSSPQTTPFMETLSPQDDQELREPSIQLVPAEIVDIENVSAPVLAQLPPFDHSEVIIHAEPLRGLSNRDDHGLHHQVDDGSNTAATTLLRDHPLHSASRATWTPRTGDLLRSSSTSPQFQCFSSANSTDGGQQQHRQLHVPGAGLPSHQHHPATLSGHPGDIHSSAFSRLRSTDDCLVAADSNQRHPAASSDTGSGIRAQHGHHPARLGSIGERLPSFTLLSSLADTSPMTAATPHSGDSLQPYHALDSIVASDPQHGHAARSLATHPAHLPEPSLGDTNAHSDQLPAPATSLSAAIPGWSLPSSVDSVPEPVRLQLITGEWITVSAVTATACGSSVPAQYCPIDSVPSGSSSDHVSVTASAIPVHSIQPRPATSPDATSGSGIDPCESWELSDSDSEIVEDTHSLSPSQRRQAADYNKQLVRQQLVGDAVTYSRQNVVLTMCTLWPLSIILESATRRTKLSTVHELLYSYTKHYSQYIKALTHDLQRKQGPELQLALRTTANSMYLVRNEYPIEVVQLTILLHITEKIRDSRLSARIQMLQHLCDEAMWTPCDDLHTLWSEVLRLHESPMTAQLHAQTQGAGIWSSPGVITFSPHHALFTENWTQFYQCCLHVLCYQPKESIKRQFPRALATFNDPGWKQNHNQSVREFNAEFKANLGVLRQAASLDGLDVGEVVPKDTALVTSYKSRLLKTKREACLRSLKQKTYTVDYPLLDLDYAGNTLDCLTLADLMVLASVAWRQEDDVEPHDYSGKYDKYRHSSPTGAQGARRSQAQRSPGTTQWRTSGQRTRTARAAAATTDTGKESSIPDIAVMQKDTKSQINTSSNYLKVGKYFLAPAYKYGHTDCDNCKQPHWHDQPCAKTNQANSVIPNSKRHSKATRQMIELMNLGRFFRLSQRFQGGKDGKSPSSSERAAITGSPTKPDKPSSRHQSRETQAARAAAASAKL